MSKVLGISKSGYYKWLKIEPKKSLRSRQLDEQVKSAFSKNHMVYGSSRIAQYLEENNTVTYSRTTVARCMQRLNLVARPKRKFVVARDSDHDFKIADNLLDTLMWNASIPVGSVISRISLKIWWVMHRA